MSNNGIGTRMAWWWYLVLLTIDLIRAQNPFDGIGFLADPFLELTSGVTTPANQKTNKSDLTCISHGTLAGSIIATFLLSLFIAFLTWMIYLRQKLQELQSYENQEKKHIETSSQYQPALSLSKQSKKQHINDDISDTKGNQLPLDVTDYKFGTFPFRQSQTPSVSGHYYHTDWLNRVPSSFRSVTTDQDTQMMDIALLNPTFCGLNFSITGNMRAGIFVKDILDKQISTGQSQLNSCNQLRTGDRIIALTVCFESIVYEDALTILSYASPYPVMLRVQRPIHPTKINVVTEKQPPITTTTTNKVKWRDGFEHYDNDTPHNRALTQPDSAKTLSTEINSTPSPSHQRSLSKQTPIQSRTNKSSSTIKGNQLKTASNTVQSTKKRSSIGKKPRETQIPNQMMFISTGLSSKPIDKISTPPIPPNKTALKSVTNAVISYLHYRDANGGYVTDAASNSEAALMPYYDSPYDYYGAQISQSQLNTNNNNNSGSTESLTAVTSVYTLQLSSTKPNLSTERTIIPRRCERRLSSPAIILPMIIEKTDEKDLSLKNIDTFV